MAGAIHRGALALVAAAVLLIATTGIAGAYGQSEGPAPVTTDGTVVSVTLVRTDGTPRVVGTNGGGNGSNFNEALGCYYSVVQVRSEIATVERFGPPPTPDSVPYEIYCGGAFVRTIWITPADIVDYDDIARGEADRYLETVLGPGLDLHHAPNTYAVTGAPSHHWITGWNGAPIAVPPINPFGDQLDITLTLESITWDFGDGTANPGDLGTPAPSTVQHTYTHRSTETDPNGTYDVAATVTIGVTYTINGGAPITVTPPLTTDLTAPVIVRELQAVLD